jgi:hypothetical protein
MQKKDAIGTKPADRSDWNNAWEIVSRLAAAREATLQGIGQEIGQDRREPAIPEGARPISNSAGAPAKATEPVDQDQLAHAVAEIEKASAALRQAEPGLEAGLAHAPTRARKYWSVWILVGGVWLSATLVVAGATGAILYLFG